MAVGLVAIVFSLIFFSVQDISILLTGKPLTFIMPRTVLYTLLAAIAVLFSTLTVFVWRGVVPRLLIGLFAVSMLTHIVEYYVILPASQMRVLATCRIAVSLGLVLLFLQYYRGAGAVDSG